jgi:predicted HAD superfamily Cof-like phosphohydrolase
VSAASDMLRVFHEAFDVPSSPLKAVVKQRLYLHETEHDELEDALADLGRSIKSNRRACLEALADELADEAIVTYGDADLLGIDLDKAIDIKMASNMLKLPECPNPACEKGEVLDHQASRNRPYAVYLSCPDCGGSGHGEPIRDPETGKVLRPDGWVKPSMSEAIRERTKR